MDLAPSFNTKPMNRIGLGFNNKPNNPVEVADEDADGDDDDDDE